MKIRLWVGVVLATAASSVAAQKSDVYLYEGFMRGETYLSLPDARRSAYVMGLVDGFLYAPAFDAPSASITWLHSCVSGMTNTQLTAVIDQQVRSNPIDWQVPMHVLAGNALRKTCPNAPGTAVPQQPASRGP